MSVGILSAVGRIWGKALQTDAAVSPNNYGGPLVDIRGRVMGVIVPLSPQSADEIAGVEWYDSGIGFAVPAEHIRKMLPKLKQGHDLYAGVAGFNLQSPRPLRRRHRHRRLSSQFARRQGRLQAGDRIVEIAGRKITRPAEVKEEISRRYAGDKDYRGRTPRQKADPGRDRVVRQARPVSAPLAGHPPLAGDGQRRRDRPLCLSAVSCRGPASPPATCS